MRWTSLPKPQLKKLMRWTSQNSGLKRSAVPKRSLPALRQPQREESGSVILEETSGDTTFHVRIARNTSSWSGSKSLGTTPRLKKEGQTGSKYGHLLTTFANCVRVRFRIPIKWQRCAMGSGFPRIKRACRVSDLTTCRLFTPQTANALGVILPSHSWKPKAQ